MRSPPVSQQRNLLRGLQRIRGCTRAGFLTSQPGFSNELRRAPPPDIFSMRPCCLSRLF
jgi:hypothetical protein